MKEKDREMERAHSANGQMVGLESGHNSQPRTVSGSHSGRSGDHALGQSFASFSVLRQRAEYEMEQPGLTVAPLWSADVTGGGLTHCTTVSPSIY